MRGSRFSPRKLDEMALNRPSRLVPGVKILKSPKKNPDEKFETMTLEELKIARDNANKALNFELSEKLSAAIASFVPKSLEETIKQTQTELSDAISTAIENFNQRKLELNDEMEDTQFALRTAINKQFEVLKARHIRALTQLEIDRDVELLREKNRPSAEEGRSTKAAMILAKSELFAEARALRISMQKDKEEELVRRSKNVNDKYDKAVRNLNTKHAEELGKLQEELELRLKALEMEHNDRERVLEKTLNVFVKHILQKSIVEVSDKFARHPKRSHISSALEAHVQNTFRDKIGKY